MPDDLKSLYAHYLEEIWVKRNRAALPGYYAPGFVDHSHLPGMAPGVEGVLQRFDGLLAAFPDAKFTVIESVVEGEKIASLIHLEGTNTGSFMGTPATGNYVSIQSFDISRFEDGKIAEHWEQFDLLGMMQQLGLAPMPEESPHAPGATSTGAGEVFSVGEDAGDV